MDSPEIFNEKKAFLVNIEQYILQMMSFPFSKISLNVSNPVSEALKLAPFFASNVCKLLAWCSDEAKSSKTAAKDKI